MDRGIPETSYLMFLAFDTGRVDDNGKRIMQYFRKCSMFPIEEMVSAMDWLSAALAKDASRTVAAQPKTPPIPVHIKPGEKPHLLREKVKERMNNSQAVKMAAFLEKDMKHDPEINKKVFGVLQELKKINPGDTYYEAYQAHWKKHGDKFYDHYHLAWQMKEWPLRNIMEIGTRTGTSLCQMLYALKDAGEEYTTYPPKIVSFDLFNDGFISPQLVKLNLQYLGIPVEPEFITGDSLQTVPAYKANHPGELFDWILVDGNHEAGHARQDLANVVDMVAPGGLIVFDDISTDPGECALLPVWEEFEAAHADEFYFFKNMNGKGVAVAVKK